MKLNQFPKAIANAEQAFNEINAQLAGLDQTITHLELQAEAIVAFDANLKNESQRKVRKHELLLPSKPHQDALDKQAALTIKKADAITALNLLKNQFSVAQLKSPKLEHSPSRLVLIMFGRMVMRRLSLQSLGQY